jgi:hypothetical protein
MLAQRVLTVQVRALFGKRFDIKPPRGKLLAGG